MDTPRFNQLVRKMVGGGSRRGLLRLGASLPLAGSLAAWLGSDDADAKKKRKYKHKKKKTCGKAGSKPIKGKCCAGSILLDSACQRCDVCGSGCAFSGVQPAIDAAEDGDTVVICPGTFVGDLSIEKDLRLLGAGAAATVLRGTGTDTVVRVQTNTVDLENLQITGGNGGVGGGIENGRSTLTLRNVLVSENSAESKGGGIFNNDVLNLIDSEVRGNEAENGGGIYNLSGSGNTVTCNGASRVTGNTASNTGGGIYNENATILLASSANVSDNDPNNCAGTTVLNCIG
jgi:hypothetical protein